MSHGTDRMSHGTDRTAWWQNTNPRARATPESLHFVIKPNSYHVTPYYHKQNTVMTHESLVDVDGKVSCCKVGASKIYWRYLGALASRTFEWKSSRVATWGSRDANKSNNANVWSGQSLQLENLFWLALDNSDNWLANAPYCWRKSRAKMSTQVTLEHQVLG